jgi:lipopolysaccharide transport system ATP-binding protein
MSHPIITIERLGKAYRLGQTLQKHATLRDAIARFAKAPLHRLRRLSENFAADDTFWALKDVSFEVHRGEVIGLIGRNGAGKSTLLKILSRITEPTEGQARLRGRVASLLEVGTGFHPELTGRENIFLNGAILGMGREEIKRKFDEIVFFSEVEKFLDTPVKRYSSGMYVRLAFAVAAHLEPEILIVDEVLAVGDMEFQKKCLGKMQEVTSGEGRTVIFVSHNMDAVMSLCSHVILFDRGRASERMKPLDGVTQYLAAGGEENIPLIERHRFQNHPRPNAFSRLSIRGAMRGNHVIPAGDAVTFEVDLENVQDLSRAVVALVITDDRGQRVTMFATHHHGGPLVGATQHMSLICRVPSLPLTPGAYFVDLILSDERQTLERVERAGRLEVIFNDMLGTGRLPTYKQGHVVMPCQWSAA